MSLPKTPMYLDTTEALICSMAVNVDAESGNLVQITVCDGKTVAQAT